MLWAPWWSKSQTLCSPSGWVRGHAHEVVPEGLWLPLRDRPPATGSLEVDSGVRFPDLGLGEQTQEMG